MCFGFILLDANFFPAWGAGRGGRACSDARGVQGSGRIRGSSTACQTA